MLELLYQTLDTGLRPLNFWVEKFYTSVKKGQKKDFKTIKGKIVKLHGRSGCFIARFKTNLPPSAITNFVYIKKTNL